MNTKQAISLLFVTWPRRESDPPIEAMLKAYEFAVDGIRPQYVAQAVRAFIQGRVPDENKQFRPSAPRVAEYARALQSSDERIREIADRATNEPKRIGLERAPQAAIDDSVNRWKKARQGIPDLDPIPVPKRPLPYWDNNPARWHSKEALQKSMKRLIERGLADEPKPPRSPMADV